MPPSARRAAAVLALLLAGSARAAGPSPAWEIAAATPNGKVLVARVPEATIRAAIRRTVRELGPYFGAAPVLRSAYEDARVPGAGGATFTVSAWGEPAKGTITCRAGGTGTRVAVAFVRASAPAAEWERLTRAAAPGAGAAGGEQGAGAPGGVAAATGPLRTYRFPDGTGSVGLVEGWRTSAQSALGGVHLEGPGDASVMLGQVFSVATPGSPVAQMGASRVAPYGSPAEVLRAIVPQLSAFSQRNGGPAIAVDHLEKREDRRSTLPQGRAAVLSWGVTETPRGGPARHYLAVALVELAPFSPTGFMVSLYSARAPDASFAARLPEMIQMMQSLKTDDARIAAKAQEGVAAQQRWFAGQQAAHRAQVQAFEAQQEAHRERVRAFDERNRSWEQGQLSRARSNDDFDEVIRGVRTVEDTKTGEKRSVSLGDVDRYVDDLNTADPGRYRQIPLRDEADPLPGR